MPNLRLCLVDGCENQIHAKGYCRKHYGQIWRKGRINHEKDSHNERVAVSPLHDDSDRMRALEREFRKAQHMYKQVVGFEGRLKWRKEMEEVRKEIERLSLPKVVAAT